LYLTLAFAWSATTSDIQGSASWPINDAWLASLPGTAFP